MRSPTFSGVAASARIREQGVGVIRGVFIRIVDHQRFAAPCHIANDGFRTDPQFMIQPLHLRAGFAGRFANHRKFMWQIDQEYRGMVEVEPVADELNGLRQYFVEI